MTLKGVLRTDWDRNAGIVSTFHDDRLFCKFNLVILAFKGLFTCAVRFMSLEPDPMQSPG